MCKLVKWQGIQTKIPFKKLVTKLELHIDLAFLEIQNNTNIFSYLNYTLIDRGDI